jgi:hypothetical protein
VALAIDDHQVDLVEAVWRPSVSGVTQSTSVATI